MIDIRAISSSQSQEKVTTASEERLREATHQKH